MASFGNPPLLFPLLFPLLSLSRENERCGGLSLRLETVCVEEMRRRSPSLWRALVRLFPALSLFLLLSFS